MEWAQRSARSRRGRLFPYTPQDNFGYLFNWKSLMAKQLNTWLNSNDLEWQKVRDTLQRHLNENEEINVIVETDNTRLRRLPWQEWDLFSNLVFRYN